MIPIHSFSIILLIALLHWSTANVIQMPTFDLNDQGSVYIPRKQQPNNALGSLMRTAYNHSIPAEAIKACELELGIACPSPSSDGTHKCITSGDICDYRPQCPGAEDETPVICFFHEMHSMELARLRIHAITLYREMAHHAPRSHGK